MGGQTSCVECKCFENQQPAAPVELITYPAEPATDGSIQEPDVVKLGRRASMILDGVELTVRNSEDDNDMQEVEDIRDQEKDADEEVLRLSNRLNTPDSGANQGMSNHVSGALQRVSQRVSAILSLQKVIQQKPDFTGTWKMVKYDGDFQEFMKEMGVGWALRKAANAVGYGVNATYHTIEMTLDRIKVTTKNPKGTFLKDYAVDASEQDDVDPVTKEPIKVVPTWEWQEGEDFAILKIKAYKPSTRGDAIEMPLTKRYLQGPLMIMEQRSPNGITVKRYFEKQ